MHDPRSTRLEIRHEAADASPGREMLAAMLVYLDELYGSAPPGSMPTATPEEMGPPGGTFVVLRADGAPVACGGLKRLGPGLAEIKRMWVDPSARGRGHARRILAALEDAARELGYPRVRLDTGRLQPHARALYASAGYTEIPDYNDNPHAAHWFEKRL